MFKKTDKGFVSKYQPVINTTDAVIFTLPPPEMAAEPVVIVYRRTDPEEQADDPAGKRGGVTDGVAE